MLSRWWFRGSSSFAALMSAIALAGASHATVLIPSETAPPDVFTAPSSAKLGVGTFATWANTTATISGTVRSAVFTDPTNTFCAGCLDFMYQVSNDSSSLDAIDRVTGVTFSGFETDVGYLPDGSALPGAFFVDGSVAPQLVDRSTGGELIGFSFNSPTVPAGDTSMVLVVETNATRFALGRISILDGGTTTAVDLEPSTAPEPADWALMLVGAGAIGLSLRAARRARGELRAA